ncbi:MAG: hypothetical protein BGO01_12495 [Armatimonadetes bacterium 55-13]|nr:glycosyltransferase [Armatimonadota bacterium]OJU61732.1 MAG: hypothetical protein BGO01_12495 [Armatimonadetes bacterium 55-13]
MSSSPVFYDPSGRRKKVASRSILGFGLIAAIATSLFGLSLLALPVLPGVPKGHHGYLPHFPRLDQKRAGALLQQTKRELAKSRTHPVAAKKVHLPLPTDQKLAVGFYAPWQQTGLKSFELNAKNLTHVAPAWLSLTANGQGLNTQDFDLSENASNQEVIRIARQNGVAILPVLGNSDHGVFDSQRVRTLLTSQPAQEHLIQSIQRWQTAYGFQGLNVDFELVPDSLWPNYVQFLHRLGTSLHLKDRILTVDLEASLEPRQISQALDEVNWGVLMLYDEHSETDSPGPIASLPWSNRTLRQVLNLVPEDKLVVGLGAYAYDWEKGQPSAQSLTFEDAMATAAGYRDSEAPEDVIEIDPSSVNPEFEYDDDNGKDHKVWMLDAITAYNQWRDAQAMDARGAALWVMGSEDPAIWSFLDKGKLNRPPESSGLEAIDFPQSVDFVGKGEILDVKARPQDGRRRVQPDPNSGEIFDWSYRKYAFPFVLQKSGYQPKRLVLTFDDGPDPEYTPQILDELKRLGVPGTFFLIGQNAEEHPDIVERIYAEGHEIGNHSFTHPDIGAVGDRRAALELNATQRAIESITGRSTILFRPPYNADSQPSTPDQVAPVEIADRLHYVTVGENIDPQDWDLRVPLGNGQSRSKTADDIVRDVLRDVRSRQGTDNEGNIILLHDAGGDRSATVAALAQIVPALQKEGYKFVTVGDLIGKPHAQIMPPIPDSERSLIGLDRTIFAVSFWTERILTFAFLAAIALGLGRAVVMTILASLSRRKHRLLSALPHQPTVSVVIAAFNEEKVVVRTLQSVLASRYPVEEILIVDDGSTDRTVEVIRGAFANTPRVRLIQKTNGGKASALNLAIEQARGEVLFGIDADTQLDSEAISHLVAHFADPRVAAVAGNVKVGNAQNLLTRWQSLEYTTSQNVDRRAFGLLNCITVVPGAIGAWRASAVRQVGGYESDTLAEDMDLTWRLRMAGYRLANEPRAIAYTEAPQSFGAFFKQRFRWAYGTLQCLVKHRKALGRYGWFGWFAIPSLWLFQIVFQILAPLIDLKILTTLATFLLAWKSGGSTELQSSSAAFDQLVTLSVLYGLFFAVELSAAWLAYRWERAPKIDLLYLFLQRLVYRQMMYGVVLQSLWRALGGGRQGWNKLQRTGAVRTN